MERRHLNSYLHSILNALKASEIPLSLSDIIQRTGIQLNAYPEIIQLLKDNDRIRVTEDGNGFEYKTRYKIRSKDDLCRLLRELPRYHGLPLQDLKESCSKIEEYVQELVAMREIICMSHREGVSKVLFFNWHRDNIGLAPEFVKMWHSITLPFDDDLEKELAKAGLKSMEVFEAAAQAQPKIKKRKSRANKRIRLTNVHLEGIDLTKDYVATPK